MENDLHFLIGLYNIHLNLFSIVIKFTFYQFSNIVNTFITKLYTIILRICPPAVVFQSAGLASATLVRCARTCDEIVVLPLLWKLNINNSRHTRVEWMNVGSLARGTCDRRFDVQTCLSDLHRTHVMTTLMTHLWLFIFYFSKMFCLIRSWFSDQLILFSINALF